MSSLFKQFDYLQTVNSTNDYLKTFVEDSEPRMVVAQEQKAGKGRYGRGWHSPPDEGLYVSYLLYPGWKVERAPFLNMISGLAVAHTIHEQGGTGLRLKLKAPNDVLIEGKKVCGILSEMGTLHDRIGWAIIGIGVNLSQKDFPGELSHKATSLRLQGLTVSHPLDFCDCLTRQLERLYRQLEKGNWDVIQAQFEKMSGVRP